MQMKEEEKYNKTNKHIPYDHGKACEKCNNLHTFKNATFSFKLIAQR